MNRHKIEGFGETCDSANPNAEYRIPEFDGLLLLTLLPALLTVLLKLDRYGTGNNHRILHGLKLRTQSRRSGGKTSGSEGRYQVAQLDAVRPWRI